MTAVDQELPPMPEGLDPVGTPDKDESGYEDYYGDLDTETWYFPDGKQFMVFQPMNEGQRAKFQRSTSRDVTVERQSGDARLKVDQASERTELIMTSVVDWKLMRRGSDRKFKSVPFNNNGMGSELAKWLQQANPKLVDSLENAIRKANPWMLDQLSVEEIEKEQERLEEMKQDLLKRQAGEDSSSDK